MDFIHKLIRGKKHPHADNVCIQSQQTAKRKSLPDSDADFIHSVVEELIDRIPERSAISPVELSSSLSRSSLSNECVPDLEPEDLSKRLQDTDSVTEYESAADTDRSGKLSSSASLLTFSEQLNYEPRDDSCTCSLSENEKKLDCECSLKLSDSSVGDEAPNFVLNAESLVLDSSSVDENNKQKILPPLNVKINEEISPTDSCTSPEVNNFVVVEETSNVGNVDLSDDGNTSCSIEIGIEQQSTESEIPSQKSNDKEDHCQWNVVHSDESPICVLAKEQNKEQNTDILSKSPEQIPICDTSPVSILVSSLADSFGDQSTSSCSEVLKASADLEIEKPSQSEVLSGYVSENFSFVAAEASKIAEDIFNALEDLDGDDTIGKELKMSSLGEVDSDVLDGNYPKSQCEQTSNSLPQNYYLDGGTKETANSQNTLRMKKSQDDDLLENSGKNHKELEGSNTESPSKMKAADVGACAGENVDGNTKSNHDKESMYNKFDNLVDVVSRRPLPHEDDSLPVDSSVDDNENSRSSLQIDDSRSTPVRNQALDYIDKLISLTPNQSPRNRSTASDMSHSDSQKDSLIQEPSNNSSSATKWCDISNIDLQKMPDRLRQLREVILQQEALHKEEMKKYQRKMKSLEDREMQINRKMLENSQGQQQMSLILEEYEKTISRLVAEKEHERQAYDLEKENLIKEKDAISGHLSNIEIAFSDVHQKYEKSKQVIQGFKNNEEALRATVSDYETALKKQEQKYEILKSHAMGQLESANQELIAMRRTHEAENSKLKAMLKKAEIKIHSLEETLQQKIKENQELVNICDELIGKVGSSE
ncbi:hypothetical protein R5R35_001297 [Gryllus longicercus]|uniref:Transforming acidic coiled-coil-containing protein C-terminal domain-containing protein n=1 Tax=Gryllus longicercus TaxID=2509291 RepID=A0AAN9Z9I7_9ORTH